MSSTQKAKAKEHCLGLETESRTTPSVPSFERGGRHLSASNASAKQQDESKNPVHVDSHRWSLSESHDLGSPIPSLQSFVDRFNSADVQMIQNQGSHNQLHIGDVNILQFYNSAQANRLPSKSKSMAIAAIYIEGIQRVLAALFRFSSTSPSTTTEFEKNGSEGKLVEAYIDHLIEYIKSVMESDRLRITSALRDHLRILRSELCRGRKQLLKTDNNFADIETVSLDIVSKLKLFLFENQMEGYIPPETVVEEVKKRMKEAQRNAEAAAPLMKHLSRAKAAYDDYVSGRQGRVSCFKGTREALLKEMGEWVATAETNIFALSGLAGIGKSTIAQTIAERADNVGLLGASFFFSRDEAERRTVEKFFLTIAFHLCVHDQEFATAIESVLKTEQGWDALTKHPMEQLETLIVEPLRKLAPRRVLIVIDALDECNEEDGPTILRGLHQLVQSLPSFKVILTTRPQQHFQLLLDSEGPQKVFHLHNIEDKVVDSDIRLYLKHHLSREMIRGHFQHPVEEWNASENEIESLVKAAGRLFIIASTSVLFILDKAAHNPEQRMKQLLQAIAHDKTPFEALNKFYTVILRSALPIGSDLHAVDRYQAVVGAIMVIQTPLPVEQLAKLISYQPMDVRRVLIKLQPVILLDNANDVPRVYHKSFPDYIQDPAHCKDEDLRVDIQLRHTGMAANCFKMMNQQLQGNIFELGDPERFMENATVRELYITDDLFEKKVPVELRYACTFWANHIQGSDMDDQTLVDSLESFINEHLLHWFEALSWIGQLSTAPSSLAMLQRQLKSTSGLGELVTDGTRFIAKFHALINQSALHTYHSALPFTPTKTSFYNRYNKQMSFCQVLGGQEKWGTLVTKVSLRSEQQSHDIAHAQDVVFSPNSKMFACLYHDLLIICDTVSGMIIGRIKGGAIAIADDFSKAAATDNSNRRITLYNIKGVTPVATIEHSTTVIDLNLAPDGSRLVVVSEDYTVGLWDTAEKCKLITNLSLGGRADRGVAYSSDGNRIIVLGENIGAKLLDGRTGRIVADLAFKTPQMIFSGDGSRLASLTDGTLRLWRSEDGAQIGMEKCKGRELAISHTGFILVTRGFFDFKLWRWRGSNKGFELLEMFNQSIHSLSISRNMLFGFSDAAGIFIYDFKWDTFKPVKPLPMSSILTIAFSPDCTRMATLDVDYHVSLWDVPSIMAYNTPSKRHSGPTQLAFSPDCSRLASGHWDGTIKLWDTSSPTKPLAVRSGHSKRVSALAFGFDGRTFASGSWGGTVQLWKDWIGRKCVPSAVLKELGPVKAVALSSEIVAATADKRIVLRRLRARGAISTLHESYTELLMLSNDNRFLATATDHGVKLWNIDVESCTLGKIADFDCVGTSIMVFSPDSSQLAVQCYEGPRLFDIHDKRASKDQDLSSFGLCPYWHGVPVWIHKDNVVARFPQQAEPVTVLYTPNGLDVRAQATGSSMIALGCDDGRILLVKAV